MLLVETFFGVILAIVSASSDELPTLFWEHLLELSWTKLNPHENMKSIFSTSRVEKSNQCDWVPDLGDAQVHQTATIKLEALFLGMEWSISCSRWANKIEGNHTEKGEGILGILIAQISWQTASDWGNSNAKSGSNCLWSSKCDLPKLKKNSSTAFHICPASSSFLSLKASLRANSGVVEWQLLINRSIHPQRNSRRKHQGSDPQKGKCRSFHVNHKTMSLLHASPSTKRYSGSAWSVTKYSECSFRGQSTTNMACLFTNAVMPWSASFHFSSCLKKLKFICKLVNTNECRFLHSQSHFSSASVHWDLDFSSLLLLRRLGRRRVESKVPSIFLCRNHTRTAGTWFGSYESYLLLQTSEPLSYFKQVLNVSLQHVSVSPLGCRGGAMAPGFGVLGSPWC